MGGVDVDEEDLGVGVVKISGVDIVFLEHLGVVVGSYSWLPSLQRKDSVNDGGKR